MNLQFLRGHVTLAHVVVLNVITTVAVAILVMGATGAGAAAPQAFQGAGSFRLASAVQAAPVEVQGSTQKTVASLQFTVPSGHKADIQATYNGQIQSTTSGAEVGVCFAGMKLDSGSSFLKPGEVLVLDRRIDVLAGDTLTLNDTLQAFKNGIGPGTHTLKVIGDAAGSNGCWYELGSVTVVANVH
jgi:hypothetical protein